MKKIKFGLIVLTVLLFSVVLSFSSCGKPKINVNGTVKYLTEDDYYSGDIDDKLKDSLTVGVGERAYVVIDYVLSGISKIDENSVATVKVYFEGASRFKVEDIPTTDYSGIENNTGYTMNIKIYDAEKNEKRFRFIFYVTKLSGGAVSFDAKFIIPGENGKKKISASGNMYPDGHITVDQSILVESKLDYQLSADGTYYTVTGIGRERGDVIEIPDKFRGVPVKEIADNVFSNVSYLTKVTLPSELTKIGAGAFQGCTGIEEIRVPLSVTEVGDNAFADCPEMHVICEAKEKPSTWKESSLSGLKYLTWNCSCAFEFKLNDDGVSYTLASVQSAVKGEIEIPDTYKNLPVTKVGASFALSDEITGINIPNSVTALVIRGCSSVKSILIPDSVTVLTVSGFSALESIDIPSSVKSLSISDCPSITEIIIPESVTSIGRFSGCAALTSITVPSGIKSIPYEAFKGCKALAEVNLPNTITEIGSGAFENCDSLTTLTVPDSVKDLWGPIAAGCDNLKTIVVGSGVTWIDENVFMNCTGLEKIIFKDTSTWYRTKMNTDYDDRSKGTRVDVSDPAANVSLFSVTFIEGHTYMWYKK